jgi:hypothetical protein
VLERAADVVDDRDLVTLLVEAVGQFGAHTPASDDDEEH